MLLLSYCYAECGKKEASLQQKDPTGSYWYTTHTAAVTITINSYEYLWYVLLPPGYLSCPVLTFPRGVIHTRTHAHHHFFLGMILHKITEESFVYHIYNILDTCGTRSSAVTLLTCHKKKIKKCTSLTQNAAKRQAPIKSPPANSRTAEQRASSRRIHDPWILMTFVLYVFHS